MIFKHNPKYDYFWPDERLLSPTRVLDRTTDKTFLEKWRQKVGEEEANRIMNRSMAIGKSMHSYIEGKIKGHDLVLQNEYKDVASDLGDLIINKGLKGKLEEYWGAEAHVHFGYYYRGIVDLVGIYEGEPCVIDFKQKRKSQRQYYDSISNYFTQAAAYGMAHNKMFKTNIKKGVILLATHDHKFQVFEVKGKEWNKHCRDFLSRLRKCLKNEKAQTHILV